MSHTPPCHCWAGGQTDWLSSTPRLGLPETAALVLKKAQSEVEGRAEMEEWRLRQLLSPDPAVPDARSALGFGGP